MSFIQPLDLQTILENFLAGDWLLFLLIAFLGISMLAGRFRMPNVIFLVLIGLFPVALMAYYTSIGAVVIVLAAIIVVYTIVRLANRM